MACYSGWNGKKGNLGAAMRHVLGPPSRRWWAALSMRKVRVARGCHPAQGSPLNKAWHHRNASCPLSFVSHSFPKSSSLWSSSWLVWCFPPSQEWRWVPLLQPRENKCCCVSFLFLMERHGRKRVEQMGVSASKESKDKWRNIGVGEPLLSGIINLSLTETHQSRKL